VDVIEEKGLGDDVWRLFTKKEPIISIVAALKSNGYRISYPQVARYIKNRVRDMEDPDRPQPGEQVPESKSTLDLITNVSLKNACTRPTAKAKALSRVPAFREKFMKDWALKLFDHMDDLPGLDKIAMEILFQCFTWAMADVDWMKVQRAEREIALKSVETKLKFSKELKAQTGTRIVVKQKDGSDPGSPNDRKVILFKVK
jgi:hypothetical protein